MNQANVCHTVLLGAAGSATAFAAACSLRRHWSRDVRIVAMDTNPRYLVTTSILSDAFEQVPLSAAREFPNAVAHIVDRYGVDTYLPLMPGEIETAANLREHGVFSARIALLAPPMRGSALCADKWSLVQALRAQGIPVPRTALASEPFPAEQYFLKPRLGVGSRDTKVVGASDLRAAMEDRAEDWIVQEICAPAEITVDAFRCASTGFSKSICRERVEVKSGVATKCRLFEDPRLHEYAVDIAELLEHEGSFCFQVMRSQSRWVVTDVNPRPGGGSAMCTVTGNDFFAATFARAWGESFEPLFATLSGEVYVTRQYAEFAMGSAA